MSLPKLSCNQLSLLSNNLENIYAEAHSTKTEIELIPAISGYHLYSPSVGWRGRILRVLHFFIACFVGNSFIKQKLETALKVTQEYFNQLEAFRHQYHDTVYQEYLIHAFMDLKSKFSKREIENARKQIQVFYRATYPFTRLVKNTKNDKLNKFLNTYFRIEEDNKKPFLCQATFKTVKDYVKIMALEGFNGNQLPFNIFPKLGDHNNNNFKDKNRALVSFVKKMLKAKKQGTFHVEIFHSALKSITRILNIQNPENACQLKQLEKALIKEGCILLEEFDRKHVEWRQKIKQWDKFATKDEPFYFLNQNHEKFLFSIGERLKSTEKPEDRYKVYEIHHPDTQEKYENCLMVVGPNKICHEYSEMMRFESFWGLETADIRYIHPKGKYAIVERLPYAMDSIIWKSDPKGELNVEDRKYLEPLRILIKFFLNEKNSPKNFQVEHLRFDSIGRLKTTKDCIPSGKIDYLALEEIAYKFAQSVNLPIYQYLVEPLREENYYKKVLKPFFHKAITSAFEKNVSSFESIAKKYHVEDPTLIERGKSLQKTSIQIKKDCYEAICRRYRAVNKDKLKDHICRGLLTFFERDKTFGRFWRNFQLLDLIEEIEKNPQVFVET